MIENPFSVLDRRLNRLEAMISELQSTLSLPIYRPEISTQEKPVTANELARILNTTVENIHRQKKRGTIPYRKMGGRTYFLLSEVVEAMKKVEK